MEKIREFVYYSKSAVTSGNFIKEDLMKAGRIDIACQIVIMSFFVSHHMRNNVKLHLIFDGPPDAPKHLEIFPGFSGKSSSQFADINNKIDISKKDIAGLFKKMLFKYKKSKKIEISPGYYIEKKSFSKLIEELVEEGKEIYLLDRKGEDIRSAEIKENSVFILGDQEGINKKELKKIRKYNLKKISLGPYMYFTSQSMTILQNELDRREILRE